MIIMTKKVRPERGSTILPDNSYKCVEVIARPYAKASPPEPAVTYAVWGFPGRHCAHIASMSPSAMAAFILV